MAEVLDFAGQATDVVCTPEHVGVARRQHLLNKLHQFTPNQAYAYIGHAFVAIEQLIEWLTEFVDVRCSGVRRGRWIPIDLVVERGAHVINTKSIKDVSR